MFGQATASKERAFTIDRFWHAGFRHATDKTMTVAKENDIERRWLKRHGLR